MSDAERQTLLTVTSDLQALISRVEGFLPSLPLLARHEVRTDLETLRQIKGKVLSVLGEP